MTNGRREEEIEEQNKEDERTITQRAGALIGVAQAPIATNSSRVVWSTQPWKPLLLHPQHDIWILVSLRRYPNVTFSSNYNQD